MRRYLFFILCQIYLQGFCLYSSETKPKKSSMESKISKESEIVKDATYYMVHILHTDGTIGSFKKIGAFAAKKDLQDEELIKYLNEQIEKDGVTVIVSFHDLNDKWVGNCDKWTHNISADGKHTWYGSKKTFNERWEEDPYMISIFSFSSKKLDSNSRYFPTIAREALLYNKTPVTLFYNNKGKCLKFVCIFRRYSKDNSSIVEFKKINNFKEIDLSMLEKILQINSYEYSKDYAENLENFESIGIKTEKDACVTC